MVKCIICNKILGDYNHSGYCTRCYTKSPQYKKYQANKQREWFAKPENKLKKRAYRKKNFKHYQEYQRKYQKENIERIRELKRN